MPLESVQLPVRQQTEWRGKRPKPFGDAFAMETKQEIRSFGSKIASILICLVGLFLQACEPGGPDRHGKTPEDVVTAFIQAVQAEDWILAATFWEANSILNLEANFKMPFKDYCMRACLRSRLA
jgi:hypothetical protein